MKKYKVLFILRVVLAGFILLTKSSIGGTTIEGDDEVMRMQMNRRVSFPSVLPTPGWYRGEWEDKHPISLLLGDEPTPEEMAEKGIKWTSEQKRLDKQMISELRKLRKAAQDSLLAIEDLLWRKDLSHKERRELNDTRDLLICSTNDRDLKVRLKYAMEAGDSLGIKSIRSRIELFKKTHPQLYPPPVVQEDMPSDNRIDEMSEYKHRIMRKSTSTPIWAHREQFNQKPERVADIRPETNNNPKLCVKKPRDYTRLSQDKSVKNLQQSDQDMFFT